MKESNATPSSSHSEKSATLSPGMGTLLRGGNGEPKSGNESEARSQTPEPQQSSTKRLVQVSLVFADVFLLGLAARILLKSPRPLGTADLILCVSAVVLGAALTCLALWLNRSAD